MNDKAWTDRDVVDAMATYLGTLREWSGADALEVLADLLGRVRPHPGGDDATFRREFPELTGRDLPAAWDQGERTEAEEDEEEAGDFQVQGLYSEAVGWEAVTWEENLEDARTTLREYRENAANYPHRIADAAGNPIEEENL